MTARDFAKRKRADQARDALRDLRQTKLAIQTQHPATFPLLSTNEIRRRLAFVKASDQLGRYAGRSITMRAIANRAQLSLSFLYLIVNGTRVPAPKAQQKLSAALFDVQISTNN
jgi:hypothetical protein